MTAIETRAGFFETRGGRLYFEVAGAGNAIVLIHGFTLDRRMWDDQWSFFAQRYRVIRYDARGFGRSSKPAGQYSHVDDLRALLDHLGAETVHLVGLSMGGGIALDYAVRYPEALKSLVLIDTTLGGYPHFSDEFRASTNLSDVARSAGVEVAKAAWLAHPFFESAGQNQAVWESLTEIVGDWDGWQWLNENRQVPPRVPAADQLDQIDVPALILVGERDIPDFHGVAEFLARGIRGSRLSVIPGAGHMSNMERPEAVNGAIEDFLANL